MAGSDSSLEMGRQSRRYAGWESIPASPSGVQGQRIDKAPGGPIVTDDEIS